MKKALITGITGQDGSYLTEYLLAKGYEVHGLVRRSSSFNRARIEHILHGPNHERLHLHYGDLHDSSSINHIMKEARPDEVYNLGAQSHVRISFDMPEYTGDVTALGTLRLLETIRQAKQPIKFYQASSSEMYGQVQAVPQNESTPFHPRSPYAVAKVYAYWITVNYRESYDLFATNGILFNHESPRRGENFVTKKITMSLAQIQQKKLDVLRMGNLDAKRDWGYTPDYIDAMWRMLQADRPSDYVIATGETHSVREFVEEAAPYFDLDLAWEGVGVNEKGVDRTSGKTIIEIDPRYFRPAEVDMLIGDAGKAQRELNWKATTSFKELVKIMAEADRDTVW